MFTLGIGDQTHDPSVAIAKDGIIIAAIELERLTRLKHNLKVDTGKYSIQHMGNHFEEVCSLLSQNIRETLLKKGIDYCLDVAGISEAKISYFVQSTLFNSGCFPYQSIFINHHLAHAASAFYASPFENSAILTLDGYGLAIGNSYEIGTWGIGNKNKISIIENYLGQFNLTADEKKSGIKDTIIVLENSLGAFYKNITVLAGMGHFGEGKTMGLSAYGSDNKEFSKIRDYIELLSDGKFKIDNRKIFEFLEKIISNAKTTLSKERYFKLCADMAYEAQKILEEIVIHICHHIYAITKIDNLCFAGGVALNSLLNEKIVHKTQFKNIFIQPAASDNGIALGCAYYDYYMIKEGKRDLNKSKLFSPYLGKKYNSSAIDIVLKDHDENLSEINTDIEVTAQVANLIAQGKIVCWFNDGSEIGPRALGNRSILADPRNKNLKDYLNLEIKKREWFRPFAPVILEGFVNEYFETSSDAPYMLRVIKAKDSVVSLIPAVIHVDNTARIQTINREQNELYYQLVDTFRKITGIPLLLNTSFNGKEEPIVESPEDAIKCFIKLNLDVLVLNSRIFLNRRKEAAFRQDRGNTNAASKKDAVTGEII